MTQQIENTDIKKVFIYTGTVVHLLDLSKPLPEKIPAERAPARCGYRPLWPGVWLTAEMEELFAKIIDVRPICGGCERLMGETGDDNGEPHS